MGLRFASGRLGALAFVTALCGCSPAQYVPNLVGIVRDVDYGAQDTRYTLANGQQFAFPRNGNFITGEPQVDSILLAGSAPVPWVSSAAIRAPSATTPDGCYAIYGKATADETHVFQTVGTRTGEVVMVFPKSANWVDYGVEGLFGLFNQLKGGYTCVNPQGQAFERGL